MSDWDWPPTRTVTLGAALDDADDRLADARAELERLHDAEDATDRAIQEAQSEASDAEEVRNALRWAVAGAGDFEGWGRDAEVTFEAFTADKRATVIETIARETMGSPGAAESETWLTAAGVVAAPWMDDGAGLHERKRILGSALPPGLRDWCTEQLNDLSDLSQGN